MKLGAFELRRTTYVGDEQKHIKRNPIYLILDNVLDTYNTGAIFRLADAVAAEKVYLCGETLTPPHHRIKKASVNTWQWMPWEYAEYAGEVLEKINTQHPHVQCVAVEQSDKSVPFDTFTYEFPLALVVGNETNGVSKEALDRVDYVVEIPMWGVNKSLNVMVSTAIVLYEVMKQKATKYPNSASWRTNNPINNK